MELEKGQISINTGAKIYAQLKKDIDEKGILERSYGYYTALTFISFSGFILSAYFIYISNSLIFLLLSCIALVFASVQLGGLLHDAGHRAIFKSARANDILGNIAGSILVMGYTRWRSVHNRHHASPNVIEEDPDTELPFHSFNKSRFLSRTGPQKLLGKYQAYLFYPVRSLFVIARRREALRDCFKPKTPLIVLKLSVYIVGIFAWFILPFVLFGFTKGLTVLLTVNILSGIYFPGIFAPNHKGMPQYKKGARVSFIEQQIVTSRNIKPGWLQDNLLVGLNYQIEHHLFTNCPRNKLNLITPYVKKICEQTGIKYTQTNILESQKIIVRELNRIAKFA